MGNEIAGDLIVSEDVIADVAGHAALECYGVVGMAAPNAADGLAKILPQSRLRRGIVVSSDVRSEGIRSHAAQGCGGSRSGNQSSLGRTA